MSIYDLGPKQRLDQTLYDFFSERFAFYQAPGVQEATVEHNYSDYEERSSGVQGIAFQDQIFEKSNFNADIKVKFWMINAIDALLRDQNPAHAENESISAPLVMLSGAINFAKKIHLMGHHLNAARTKVVRGMMALDIAKVKFGAKGSFTADITIPFAGEAKRVFFANKQPWVDVFGHNCRIEEQETPDDTCVIGTGPVALRRVSMIGLRPVLKPITKQTSPAFDPISATDPKIDALVAYESGTGYNDISIFVVEGVESATPSAPGDTDIETEVDALNAGARWCRLANINITEASSVLINTADIEIPAATSYTFSRTALALDDVDEAFTQDSFILHKYIMGLFMNGILKSETLGVNKASCNATTLVFSAPVSGLISAWFWTEIGDYVL